MLEKSKRLNLKTDFKWVASGKKIETKFARLFIKMGDNLNPRIGIAVSSKTFKKATDRNRAKRLVAQALQSTYYRLPTTVNIVALPKQGVLEVKSGDLILDLASCLRNEKIIN